MRILHACVFGVVRSSFTDLSRFVYVIYLVVGNTKFSTSVNSEWRGRNGIQNMRDNQYLSVCQHHVTSSSFCFCFSHFKLRELETEWVKMDRRGKVGSGCGSGQTCQHYHKHSLMFWRIFILNPFSVSALVEGSKADNLDRPIGDRHRRAAEESYWAYSGEQSTH